MPELDSKDRVRLALLGRPELGPTLTKLHLWNLEQYEKVVYVDADTLVLHNVDVLFDMNTHENDGRDVVWAAPDCGWPDCFNSGVMVIKPNRNTYERILGLWRSSGSFDGGDQGLLNDYFRDDSVQELLNTDQSAGVWKRLPFAFNVTPTAFYSYLPALEARQDQVRIVHFIGSEGKPWLWYVFLMYLSFISF